MTWPYRTKGDAPGPLPEKPKAKPAPKPEPKKSSYLHTLEAFLNERMRHAMPGCSVHVNTTYGFDETAITYLIPDRVLKESRDNMGRALEAISLNTPETGVDAVERATVRRRKMAIGRFRLGKFGR